MAIKQLMTEAQKAKITDLASSDDKIDAAKEIDLIGGWLPVRWTRPNILIIVLGLLTILLYGLYFWAISTTNDVILAYSFLVIEFAAGGVAVFLIRITDRERKALQSLLGCMTKIDKAIKSAGLSHERQQVVKALVDCSKGIRRYGPLFPVNLRGRILYNETRLSGRAFLELAYPSMLGSEEDLREVSEIIVRAAINIANDEWFHIKDLKAIKAGYPALKIASAWWSSDTLIPLAGAISAIIVAIIPIIA